MKRVLWFALKFVALTVPLTWLWVSGGREWFAATLFVPIAGAIYDALGLEILPVWRERYIHYLPFVALVLLTPGLGPRRRFGGLLAGAVAIFLCDVVINGIAQGRATHPVDLGMPLGVLSDALPFAVWAVVAREFVGELAARMTGRGAAPAPDSDSAPSREPAPDRDAPRDPTA